MQIAAVRELGRFGGPEASAELLQVYASGNPRVKYQVVHSLGERSATAELMRIADTERDRTLQETAIVRLGQAGGREQLARLYRRTAPDLKRPVINGLFNARAVAELIRIAQQESDPAMRAEVLHAAPPPGYTGGAGLPRKAAEEVTSGPLPMDRRRALVVFVNTVVAGIGAGLSALLGAFALRPPPRPGVTLGAGGVAVAT